MKGAAPKFISRCVAATETLPQAVGFYERFVGCPALGPPGKGLPVTPLGTSRALWVGVADYGMDCSPTTLPTGGAASNSRHS